MNRYALLALGALIGAVACQEIASPTGEPDLAVRTARSNPPPPPIDTGASVSFHSSASALRTDGASPAIGPRFSFSLKVPAQGARAAAIEDCGVNFGNIPVTYLFNPTTHSGYLHFTSDCEAGVLAGSNGMVRYANGHFTGIGTLTINYFGQLLIINLSSVTDLGSSFGPCGTFVSSDVTAAALDTGCFTLHFDTATLDGDPGDVDMGDSCFFTCSED